MNFTQLRENNILKIKFKMYNNISTTLVKRRTLNEKFKIAEYAKLESISATADKYG